MRLIFTAELHEALCLRPDLPGKSSNLQLNRNIQENEKQRKVPKSFIFILSGGSAILPHIKEKIWSLIHL